ncbi:MAG: beta-lactamase family protein [Spirochaetes bacterium]|nr:beta-lactamase family protein [Spirochaetota bacterium]
MQRRIYLLSAAAITLVAIVFFGQATVSRATTLIAFSGVRSGDERALPGPDAKARAGEYGTRFASWLDGNVPAGMVPSVAVGVIQGDRLVYHHGVRADSATRFGIASLSKTFTALLALRLHEEKILSLDAPVSRYLPGVVIERPELNSAPVTVMHLLAHTSGIPSYGRRYVRYDAGGRSLSVPEQVHPAGYCYSYSNEGYELMMHVIEAASGKPYAVCMREMVLAPLGMDNSTAEFANGTGGIVTTIQDLSKYVAMLINGGVFRGKRLLSEESFARMLANPVELPSTRVDYYYSLGWEVITVDGRVDSYYKAGRWFNQASGLQVFPKKKIAFIYLCNPPAHLCGSFMSWRQGLTGMLRSLVRKIAGDESLCTAWPSLTPDELRRYDGRYRNVITGQTVHVSYRDGMLFSDGFGGSLPLRTFTSNRFLIDSGRMLHNFVWKENRVVGLALRHGYFEAVRE